MSKLHDTDNAQEPQEPTRTGWGPSSELTQPGLYLYKDAGEPVRLVEVSHDLTNVYVIGRPGYSGAIRRFEGMFSLVQLFPVWGL